MIKNKMAKSSLDGREIVLKFTHKQDVKLLYHYHSKLKSLVDVCQLGLFHFFSTVDSR